MDNMSTSGFTEDKSTKKFVKMTFSVQFLCLKPKYKWSEPPRAHEGRSQGLFGPCR